MTSVNHIARKVPWLTSTRIFLLAIVALGISATVDAVPEKVHLVFSNHLVSFLSAILVLCTPNPAGTLPAWALTISCYRTWALMASIRFLAQMTMSSTNTSLSSSVKRYVDG